MSNDRGTQPTQFHDGYRQLYDLSGADRTTREVAVLKSDPETGVPTEVIDARASPYTVLPVDHAGEATHFAGVVCSEPGSSVDVQGGLDRPTVERGHSSIVTSTEHVSEDGPSVDTTSVARNTPLPPGGAGGATPFPADQAPVTHALHVVDGRTCFVGNDARERVPAEASKGVDAAGGYLAWAPTLPGARASIVTRLGDAAAPMRRGFGTAFDVRGPLASDMAGGGGRVFARDPTGQIRAYTADGRPQDGVVVYPGSDGAIHYIDARSGRGGRVDKVRDVAPPGYHDPAGGAQRDGAQRPDGSVQFGFAPWARAEDRRVQLGFAPWQTIESDAQRDVAAAQVQLKRAQASRDPQVIRQAQAALEQAQRAADRASAGQRSVSLGFTPWAVEQEGPRTVSFGLSGETWMVRSSIGELLVPVGAGQGSRRLRAGITGIVYPVGSQQYRAVVEQARQQNQRMIEDGTAADPDPAVQKLIQGNKDFMEDGIRQQPLGTTAQQRAEREGREGEAAVAAALADRPRETGLLLETLFGHYNDVGYPLAFNRPLVESAHDVMTYGPRWSIGYHMEVRGAWHPVVPIPETIPPDPPKPGDDKPDPKKPDPKKPPEQKKDSPPPDGQGDESNRPEDGELLPCNVWDREHPDWPTGGKGRLPGSGPGALPVPGLGEDSPTTGKTDGGADIEVPLGGTEEGRHPGTSITRNHPMAGKTVIKPRLPPMDSEGDQRQRLGGGQRMRGAPLVPRGGIRLIDAWDFNPGHTVWDVATHTIDKVNQLVSLMNERFPFAPDTIRGAGLMLPAQDLAKVRLEQFDAGTVIQVAVTTERGTETVQPHVVVKDRRGKKRLLPLAGDHLPERVLGLGDRDEDVLIRLDHGKGHKSDKSDLPTVGWDHKTKSLVVRNAPLDVEHELTIVEEDGTEVSVGETEPTANAVPRAGSDGLVPASWIGSGSVADEQTIDLGGSLLTGAGSVIKLRRGPAGDMPTLASGELYIAADTGELFVGY